MQFIKRKNMQEGEELLYAPQLHWFYTVKNMALSLPFFLILLLLWFKADSLSGLIEALLLREIIRHTFITAALLVLLNFLWRILLYLSTEYGITNKRLMLKKGIFRLIAEEIPIDRIESIYIIQGISGRIFHYGKLGIIGIGGTRPVFYMVCRPFAVRRKIAGIIEKNKAITVVHGDLSREEEVNEEPCCRYGTFVNVIPGSDK